MLYRVIATTAIATGVLVGLGACEHDAVPEDVPPDTGTSRVLLSHGDHLVRVAMALKGTRPTITEFDEVAQDPGALAAIVDDYLKSPAFGATIRDIENQTLLVRRERYKHAPPDASGLSDFEFVIELYEEPLRLIEHVVMNDRPYSEIVTLAGTVGSKRHPSMWKGVEDSFDPAGDEWQIFAYTDGRPAAGVLATGAWNTRWASNPANAQRYRAAAAARALICKDYFAGDVQLGSVDLTDEDAIDNAILTEPACVSCHQTMDPLAGFFRPFGGRVVVNKGFPITVFDAADSGGGFEATGRHNGYYGLGGETLTDAGKLMSKDSRFSSCAARRYIAWLSQIPVPDVPLDRVMAAQKVLVDSGMNLKSMVKAIVLSDDFAVSHATEPDVAETTVGMLQTRPEQLDRMMLDLFGFRWLGTTGQNNDPFVLPRTADRGFKVHGGGIEVDTKQTPVFAYSATASSFLRSFAAEAAGYAIETEFALPATDRKLLSMVELDSDDEATLRKQLAHLHTRILGEVVASDSDAVSETLALFQDLDAMVAERKTAWKLLLTALLQDLRVAYH